MRRLALSLVVLAGTSACTVLVPVGMVGNAQSQNESAAREEARDGKRRPRASPGLRGLVGLGIGLALDLGFLTFLAPELGLDFCYGPGEGDGC